MTKKIKKIYNIEKYFTVDWTVGSTCNFSCSYCPEELHDGKTTWLDTKNLRKFLDKIYKFTELPLHFILAGGEITVDPELKEKFYLIKNSRKGNLITALSNGSRTLRWWENHKNMFDVLNLTLHTEEGNAKHISAVANLMNEHADVTVNVPMMPNFWNKGIENATTVTANNNGFPTVLKPLRINFGHQFYPYNPKQLKILSDFSIFNNYNKNWKQPKSKTFNPRFQVVYTDNTKKIIYPASWINEGKNDFSGWDCYIGVEKIYIGINGNISRGSWCKAGGGRGALGNVNNLSSIKLPTDPVTCPNPRCINVTDFKTTKKNKNSSDFV